MVSVFKGNDKFFTLKRKSANGKTIISIPQSMTFTVKEKPTSKCLIKKTIGNGITQKEDGTWVIRINRDDTNNLNVTNDKLILLCDVTIVNERAETVTIVKPQEFIVFPIISD